MDLGLQGRRCVVLGGSRLVEWVPRRRTLTFPPPWMPLGGVLSGLAGGVSGMQGALLASLESTESPFSGPGPRSRDGPGRYGETRGEPEGGGEQEAGSHLDDKAPHRGAGRLAAERHGW
jgi:hypothetical protein